MIKCQQNRPDPQSLNVGVERRGIVENASQLLEDENVYRQMARVKNPYGDGRAAERIVDAMRGSM
jgi:UDP-N-acetylglucosamine 2-epimerase (non-hydrolysing)